MIWIVFVAATTLNLLIIFFWFRHVKMEIITKLLEPMAAQEDILFKLLREKEHEKYQELLRNNVFDRGSADSLFHSLGMPVNGDDDS